MSPIRGLGVIRTRKNIKTMHSLRTSTGPGRRTWQRVQEREQLEAEEAKLKARQSLWEKIREINRLLREDLPVR